MAERGFGCAKMDGVPLVSLQNHQKEYPETTTHPLGEFSPSWLDKHANAEGERVPSGEQLEPRTGEQKQSREEGCCNIDEWPP